MNLLILSLWTALSSSALLMLSPSLPLQALALLLMSGAMATAVAINTSILLGIYIILIYASGLLVLLAYFVALSPNQTLNTPSRSTSIISFSVILLILSQTWPSSMFNHLSQPFKDGSSSVITVLTPSSGALLTMIALTLVLTMIAVVKVSSLSSGPIRPWSSN
nr:NADH dehydrogenase subunit 6 [Boccardiella hamata]